MSLRITARLAERMDLFLEVASGQTLALLGANGSGKSTTLGVLAGLLRPDEGFAQLDDQVLFDLSAHPPVWLAPHRRRIGLLSQDPLLFPRMSVLDNVAFGPRSRGADAPQDHARHWLAAVDAVQFGDRRPDQLSGGQQQRVALARALATEPQLLLLDEPLAAMDVDVAANLRTVLREVLADRTAILVTHEALDAALLSDQVAVLDGGRVVEVGATADVLRRPRSAFAAGLSGLNLLRGVATSADSVFAGIEIHGEADPELRPGVAAVAIFRPEAVTVHNRQPEGSERNHFVGSVTAIEPQAHLVRVRMGDLSADITADSVARLDLAVGRPVVFAVKAAMVSLYSA